MSIDKDAYSFFEEANTDERRLITARTIREIVPLFGKDGTPANTVAGAWVDSWFVIVGKDIYSAGDVILFCEIDTLFNPTAQWLVDYAAQPGFENWKVKMEREGWILKTMRLGSLRTADSNGNASPFQPTSQGLVLPIRIVSDIAGDEFQSIHLMGAEWINRNFNLDKLLEVSKYDKETSFDEEGNPKGDFPSHIRKTKEDRVQNYVRGDNGHLSYFKNRRVTATYKLDGVSVTAWLDQNGELRIASRTYERHHDGENFYSKAVSSIPNLKQFLEAHPYIGAVQGEAVGIGIRGNNHSVNGIKMIVFNLIERDTKNPLPYSKMAALCSENNIPTVPVFQTWESFDMTEDDCIQLSNEVGIYSYSEIHHTGKNHKWGEGLVFRIDEESIDNFPDGDRQSFKAINANYLLR